ncbi:site-specific integrase [Pedobacter agri]|uniref:site-specific integrase n=1 Tax=Pedobacter agri TaxID=454586 RepID=UPI002788D484|nr:site-specific integrase [Pedobacter agri]MDQ1138646.1 site-specific recombinase XerD [Pedobacter agri]
MKTNFSLLFYLKKQKNYRGGHVPVYLRITVGGKRAEMTSGLECDPEKWNTKSGRQDGKKEDVRSFNAYLDNLQSMINQVYRDLFDAGEVITAEGIKCRFVGREVRKHTLMEGIKVHNEKMEALVGKEYAIGTLKRFQVLERHLTAFMNEKYQITDINIKNINHAFIRDFDFFLRSVNGCANNTTVRYQKSLGKILRISLSLKWIDSDPMFGYKLKSKNVERSFLTEDELTKISEKQFLTERLSQVRDVFIFCCFTGLAYSDIEKLSLANIKTGVDGKKWVFTNRTKTGTRSAVPLLPPAIAILERYSDHPYCVTKDRALPVSSNQKLNEYLKEIAAVCEINKPLSSHIARHTFATTITLLNGIPMESVSKMLGHTNIRTTQIYAKVLDIKVGADMAILQNRFSIK